MKPVRGAGRIVGGAYRYVSVTGLAVTGQLRFPSDAALPPDDDVQLSAAERAAWRRLSKQLADSSSMAR